MASVSIESFDYQLPAERIAAFPLPVRDESKLLLYKKGEISDDRYCNFDKYIQPCSFLVFNNTRVVQARLHFKTTTGATVEIFCLEPANPRIDTNIAMQETANTSWKCLVGELRKWKEEQISCKVGDGFTVYAKLNRREADTFIVDFSWSPEKYSFAEVLEQAGKLPLPPYIKRTLQQEDKNRYQTVYAEHVGSVAAPTAGLHFTERVLQKLREKKVRLEYLTLHIGAGTFKPVKSKTIGDHQMHSEQILIEKSLVQALLEKTESEVVAVGTTSLRTLESIYWLGVKIAKGLFRLDMEVAVEQWDPYTMQSDVTLDAALTAVLNFLEKHNIDVLLTRTQLIIVPGYKFKVVHALATNFHQPKSTLILLVAAFIGEDWRRVYDHALTNGYRFLSYGDGSLLFRKGP